MRRTSLGPLLVHDSVGAGEAPDGLLGLDLILLAAVCGKSNMSQARSLHHSLLRTTANVRQLLAHDRRGGHASLPLLVDVHGGGANSTRQTDAHQRYTDDHQAAGQWEDCAEKLARTSQLNC